MHLWDALEHQLVVIVLKSDVVLTVIQPCQAQPLQAITGSTSYVIVYELYQARILLAI